MNLHARIAKLETASGPQHGIGTLAERMRRCEASPSYQRDDSLDGMVAELETCNPGSLKHRMLQRGIELAMRKQSTGVEGFA